MRTEIKEEEVRLGISANVGGVDIGVSYSVMQLWLAGYVKLYAIPLSKEWLVRFGFTKEDMADLGNFFYLTISNEMELNINNGTIWMGEYDTGVEHVHQLQNLYFALTQKELSLKDENTL